MGEQMTIEYYNPSDMWDGLSSGYSLGIKVPAPKYFVYLCGQVPLDSDRNVQGSDIETQARYAFGNAAKLLEEAGATLDDVVKLTIYVTDIKEHQWPVRRVRSEFFDEANPPPATMVQVGGLATDGLMIEIDVVAAVHA